MNDREFAELELRATICPQQCAWPKLGADWQRLHAVPNEARERASKALTRMDEIDGNADQPHEGKQHRRGEVAAQALAEFDASKTLLRAREAVRSDPSPATRKALEQAEAGWERAMNKIAERAGRAKGSRYAATTPSPLFRGVAP